MNNTIIQIRNTINEVNFHLIISEEGIIELEDRSGKKSHIQIEAWRVKL